MMVCEHCSSVVYRTADGALSAGRESLLPESDSRFFNGATGTISGRGFRVVGHLRYGHGGGSWDEWYLELDDRTEIWVSEDERQLRVQQPFDTPPGLGFENLHLGAQVSIGDRSFSVRERGTASCLGGGGQLPYRVVPGESYPFAELATADGSAFVTLEFDDDAKVHAYWGQSIEHTALVIHGEEPPSTKRADKGQNVKCSQCAGALELPARNVETIVCEYCGSALDLTDGQLRLLGRNPQGHTPEFLFEIGQQGNIRGVAYEVCGRMEYVESEYGGAFSGAAEYVTLEYLLYNPDAGYLWLSQYNNHFVINQQTDKAPDDLQLSWHASPKTGIDFDGELYRKYESGTVALRYVDGSMPWKARVGDVFEYTELVRPPFIVGIDREGQELDTFLGEYASHHEIKDAFQVDSLPSAKSVHAAQPYNRSWVMRGLIFLGGILTIGNLAMALVAYQRKGVEVFSQFLSGAEYLGGEIVSDTFAVPETKIVNLSMFADVQDSWVALDLALVNDETDTVVAEVGGEVSYYSGGIGEDRWSEGSRSDNWYFRAPPPGNYRFIAKGAGGSGNSSGPPRNEMINLRMATTPMLSRYFLGVALFCFLFPLFGWLHRASFEGRRWGSVMGDDDED